MDTAVVPGNWIWVVDEYLDVVRRKPLGAKTTGICHIFDSEENAHDFLVFRAEKRVKDALWRLERERIRLKKCERKYRRSEL